MQWRLTGLHCMVVVREGFVLLTTDARFTDRAPVKKERMLKIYGGRPFGLDHQGFLSENLRGDLLIPIREAVQNAIEAGTKTSPARIEIWVDGDGDVYVADNASGMDAKDLIKFNKDLGSGSKKKGRGKNFGIGLKLAAMITKTGLEIYSRPQGSRDRFSKIALGRVDDQGRFGVLNQNAKGDQVTAVAVPAWAHYSTVVKLQGLGVDWKGIVQYLNKRYLRLPATILVAENGVTGKEACWRTVRGAIESLVASSQYSGNKEYDTCTLWWGVRKEVPDRVLQEEFPHAPLAIAHAGEAHRWYLPMHSNNLSPWGVYAGTAELTLIVEARGTDVAHTFDRSGITQWDEDAAKAEVSSELPDRLAAWMKTYEAQYFDRHLPLEEQFVREFLEKFGDEIAGFKGSKHPGGKPGSRKGADPSDDPEGKPKPPEDNSADPTKPPTPPRKRSRGLPGYAFVEGRAIGGKKLQYDAAQHRILVNKECEDIRRLLEAARSDKERMKIRAQAAFSLIIAWARHWNTYDEVPAQEELDAAFNGMFAAKLF